MTALVAAEYLKFRTTRAAIGFVLAVLALTGIGTAGTVGSAKSAVLGSADFSQELLSGAILASLLVFLVGVFSVTSEWRHRTITRTFLVTPVRARVIVAKELWIVLLAVAFTVLAFVVILALAGIWLAVEGSPSLHFDADTVGYGGRVFLVSILWGMLGVGVGAVVQSQTFALVGSIIWILLVEALVGALLGLVDLEDVSDYLPGRALSSFDGTEGGLSPWTGGAVAAAWVVALGVLGAIRTARQDVA
jgi:ABC-2 type transport system permease protein